MESHPSVTKTNANLAMVLRFNGHLDRALEMYEDVLVNYNMSYDEDHLTVAETYSTGVDLPRCGQCTPQHPVSRIQGKLWQGLATQIQNYSSSTSFHWRYHCRMGDAFLANDHLESAMESYDKALQVYTPQVYGDCHSDIAGT